MERFYLTKRTIAHLEHINRMVEMFIYSHAFTTCNIDGFIYHILEFPIC